MIKINAIGKTCPLPVIMLKNAIKENSENEYQLSIDNDISRQNIEKYCKEHNLNYTFSKENEVFIFNISRGDSKIESIKIENNDNSFCVVIDSNEMGKGDSALGKALLKGFIYTLTELETLPKAVIFYNSGVFLPTQTSDSLEDLEKLVQMGIEILTCGACVNFYGLADEIKIGTITNMYNIVNTQIKYGKVIKP